MMNAIEGEDGGSALFEAEEVWPEETTAVIPAEQLEWLRDVMDADDRPTARFQPVYDDLIAAGSSAELPLSEMCDPVVTFRRASGRSVTAAPEAERVRAWLIALALVLLAVEIVALSW